MRGNNNHWICCQCHRPVLAVAFAQQCQRVSMSCIFRWKQLRPSLYQHIAQVRPIIVVLINNQCDFRSRLDVAHPAQLTRGNALGLFVQWCVEVRSIKGIADGYNMWVSVCISSSKPNTSRSYTFGMLKMAWSMPIEARSAKKSRAADGVMVPLRPSRLKLRVSRVVFSICS